MPQNKINMTGRIVFFQGQKQLTSALKVDLEDSELQKVIEAAHAPRLRAKET